MTKHAINAFLAASVALTNEIARLCEATGADAKEVERGLRGERRTGPHAYVSPGGPFATAPWPGTSGRSRGWPAGWAAPPRCSPPSTRATRSTPSGCTGRSRRCWPTPAPPYGATKVAVVRLTETLAHELKDAKVDVNAIAPGPLNTRLLDQVLAAGPDAAGEAFHRQALRQRDEGGVPLARGAALAVFLASASSDGITGRLLSAVWDDWGALAGQADRLAGTDLYTLRRITPADRPPAG